MSYIISEGHRIRIRDKVIAGAKKYKEKLIGKDFFVICIDGTKYDIHFFSKDYVHLTGVKSDLSDNRFFDNCIERTLSTGNILEEQKYNWNTLKGKTDRIEDIDKIVYGASSNSLFIINLHTNTGDYPVAIRNSDINTCVGFREEIHRARTLRKYTNSNNSDEEKEIIAIFAKTSSKPRFTELVYMKSSELFIKKSIDVIPHIDSSLMETIINNVDIRLFSKNSTTYKFKLLKCKKMKCKWWKCKNKKCIFWKYRRK